MNLNSNTEYYGFYIIEPFVKISTLILAIIIFWSGCNTIKEQYKSKFWDKQLNVYSELVGSASKLTIQEYNSKEYLFSKQKFLSLYYGEAYLVASKQVEGAMIDFKEELENLDNASVLGIDNILEYQQNTLKIKSLNLAKACRNSSINSWSLDIDD